MDQKNSNEPPNAPQAHVLGIRINDQSEAVLDTVAVSEDSAVAFSRQFAASFNTDNVVVLSTCNRMEIYFSGTDPVPLDKKDLLLWLSNHCGLRRLSSDDFFLHVGHDAVTHLFRVICGLDSMVLGETEVAGQVQDAFIRSQKNNLVNAFFMRLFEHGLRVNKLVRANTAIDAKSTSVASAAVRMGIASVGKLTGRPVVVVGAGQTAQTVCKHLATHQAKIVIANRTKEKAHTLAQDVSAEVIPLSQLKETMNTAVLMICATKAPRALITVEMAQTRTNTEPLHIVDISVPHNADPALNQIENISLHGILDLQQVIEQTIDDRRQEIPQAESIIETEVERFSTSQKQQIANELIVSLRSAFEQMRQDEIARYGAALAPEQLAAVESITESLVNKLLHWPTVAVKDMFTHGDVPAAHRALFKHIFGLDKTTTERKKKK